MPPSSGANCREHGRGKARGANHWHSAALIGIIVLLAIAVLLALLALFVSIEPLLRGWLVAIAIFSSVSIGSMTWLLIHRLTGGEWGRVAAPVLRPAAAMTPLLVLGFLPVLSGLHQIYPWAADPAAIPADVAHWYLNEPSFLHRSLIALGGWSFLGVMFAGGCRSRLLAGLGWHSSASASVLSRSTGTCHWNRITWPPLSPP